MRSCVYPYSRFTLVDIAVMSKITNTGKLYYKGRSLASKCIRVSHHKEFTKACIEENIIPKGMGLKFYPSACADTKFEFTHFAAEKLHHTSEEFLYYLDNHYTYALQHTLSKFMNFMVYITRKLPINISTQILNHIECFSGNLYNKLYKRRKSKISELVYNTYGTSDCFYETHEGIYKRPLDTNINHLHGRQNFASFYSDNNVSFNNLSLSGFITDLQSNFHEISSNASSYTIEGVCVHSLKAGR